MPPRVALILCFAFIVYLFRVDRSNAKPWPGLWIPLLWILIIGSREVSVWLNLQTPMAADGSYAEGSPTDRLVYSILIAAALIVLVKRGFSWSRAWSVNTAMLLFLTYCAASALWSDYTMISFKRWVKLLGTFLMVCVVLSEERPAEAVRALLRRWSYVLVPLSVLLIKYYSELGKVYDNHTGVAAYSGVTTSKNSLGALCLITGMSLVWEWVETRQRQEPPNRPLTVGRLILLLMLAWLFSKANSMTSLLCFGLGTTIFFVTRRGVLGRRSAHLAPTILFGAAVLLAAGTVFGLWAQLLIALGRDPTLTGRTGIWSLVLEIEINPLFGSGFETFWIGDRLRQLRSHYDFEINQAHNGYIEVYLSLGLIGLFLILAMCASGYRRIARQLHEEANFASFRLTFLMIILIHNLTEASFGKLSPLWFLTVLITMDYATKAGATVIDPYVAAQVGRSQRLRKPA